MTLASVKKRISTILFEVFFIVALIVSGISLGCLGVYFYGIPSIDHIRNYPFKLPSILYDQTGTQELYRLYSEENRTLIAHDAIPDTLRLATIASEDAQFYEHKGIDPLSILRAMKANIESGHIEQGGSTITQQLARALFLTNEQTLGRKIREALLAIKIDRSLSKEEILDLYLNTIPYGANTYGVEAASQMFFHKHANELTLDESALLASLPNAPTYFSPYKEHTQELKERQRDTLKKMYALGSISQEDFTRAANTETLLHISPRKDTIIAPHFVFTVLDELKQRYSEDELRTKGLRIITTLDLDLQKKAEQAVREGAAKNISRGASNAALVALDAKNGNILAMVGSKDYYDTSIDGAVNVTIEKRQPGSAFKPFAYATAFSKGFEPETPIYDTPINFGPDGSGHDYIPRNYDGKFHGRLTMRQALAMSLNVPAVQTLALAGIKDTIKLATDMGITTLTDPKRYGLSLVLGGAEVRPLDMANAFSVFGQEGFAHTTTGISSIIDRDGKKLPSIHEQQPPKQVLDAEVARKINAILSDNTARTPIFGAHSPLAFPSGITVAAKTGTTQNFRDAWTVGYTPSIAVAVWAGNNDNRPMNPGADGIFVAAPIWRAFIDQALKQFPETGFIAYQSKTPHTTLPPYSSRKTIYIEKKTGREIPESKAKKMKKGRYDSYLVGDAPGSDAVTLPENPPTTLSDIQNIYQKQP